MSCPHISKNATLGVIIIVYSYIYNKWLYEITQTLTHTANRKERKEGKGREEKMKEKKENSRQFNK